MTPNPKNIGAAPEEYPIRALVRANAAQEIYPHMPQPGSEIRVKRAGDAYWCSWGFIWNPSSLDILTEGEALPEPSPAKGPSLPEVTQPGEGVDLEAMEKIVGCELNRWWPAKCKSCGWFGSTEDAHGGNQIADTGDYDDARCPKCETVLDEYDPIQEGIPALIAEVRRLRATLRRESK